MPLGNDPTPLAELESGFGVTANAEELVKTNHARYTDEERAVALKKPNAELTESVHEDLGKLEDFIGTDEELDPEQVTVRGTGSSAMISYVYVGDRGSYEKAYVPYVEVYGSAAAKRSRTQRQLANTEPDEAAQRAAQREQQEADKRAAAAAAEHQRKAEEIVAKAREKAEEELAKAREEADKIRADAAADAQKAADKARKDSERAKADAAKAK